MKPNVFLLRTLFLNVKKPLPSKFVMTVGCQLHCVSAIKTLMPTSLLCKCVFPHAVFWAGASIECLLFLPVFVNITKFAEAYRC